MKHIHLHSPHTEAEHRNCRHGLGTELLHCVSNRSELASPAQLEECTCLAHTVVTSAAWKEASLLLVDGLMTAEKKKQSLLKELTTSGISVSAANIVTLPLGKVQGGALFMSHRQYNVPTALLVESTPTILLHQSQSCRRAMQTSSRSDSSCRLLASPAGARKGLGVRHEGW